MDPHTEVLDPYSENREQASREPAAATRYGRGAGMRAFRLAIIVALGLGLGYVFVDRQKSASEANLSDATREQAAQPAIVDAVTIAPAPPTETLTLPGETAAWDETPIYARVNGYVAKWNVDIGDHVKAGQTLAIIDTPELDAELPAANAKLNASVAEVAVKEARADFARTTEKRWQDSPKGVVSDQEREDKKAGSAEAVAELNAARAQVAMQQAEVDRLEALMRFKTVKAPFDGTIVQRQIDTGNLVTAGSTASTTSLYRIAQDDVIRIFVHAPQAVASQLERTGGRVLVTLGDAPNKRFEGKVARTARALDPQTRTLRVEIDAPNPDHEMVPGMYVRARFEIDTGDRVQVPAAAILFKSKGPSVALIDDRGAVSFRPVTIASDNGSTVTIGSGVKVGDRVAINLNSEVTQGQIVKLKPQEEATTKSASSSR